MTKLISNSTGLNEINQTTKHKATMLKLLNLESQHVLLLKHKYLYLKRFSYLYTNDFNGLGYKECLYFVRFSKLRQTLRNFEGLQFQNI